MYVGSNPTLVLHQVTQSGRVVGFQIVGSSPTNALRHCGENGKRATFRLLF